MSYKKQTDLSKQRIIKEYYNHLKPDMDFSSFAKICETPFRHLKHTMTEGNMREYTFPYMGRFVIPVGNVIKAFKNTQSRYDKGNITLQEYDYYMTMLIYHVRRNPEKFKKHKEQLSKWIKI